MTGRRLGHLRYGNALSICEYRVENHCGETLAQWGCAVCVLSRPVVSNCLQPSGLECLLKLPGKVVTDHYCGWPWVKKTEASYATQWKKKWLRFMQPKLGSQMLRYLKLSKKSDVSRSSIWKWLSQVEHNMKYLVKIPFCLGEKCPFH